MRVLDNHCKSTTTVPMSRLERLLRERELRRSTRSSHSNEETRDNNGDVDTFGNINDLYLSDGERGYREGDFIERNASAKHLNDGCEKQDGRVRKQRLIVVANRLPVSAIRRSEDSWALEISVGGLVSALLGVSEFEARWIGWAGVNVPDQVGQRSLTKALAEKRCIPVFLDEEIVHQYYNGYCNNILWPLFHYLGLPQEDRLATTRSFQSQFAAYKKANQMFAHVVNEHYREGDVVWCHDYHLMFLPRCLKDYNNKMKVGWFLHTPFPSSEIHRTLPSRSELLRSVLAADLVGFHTYDYARHFVSACTRILGLEGTPDGVEDQGKLTRVAAFPIGIDSDRFIRALELPQVKNHIKELKERFAGRKHVFEYFTERTPRSHFELRETSLVWNYKHADVEFGKLQSKDLLQHLWTGPISNASVDVVQGARSVEVRAVGVTKGAAIDRILGEIVHHNDEKAPIDYVLCIGHFLPKDEDIYTFFEPELPAGPASRSKIANSLNRFTSNSTGLAAFCHKAPLPFPAPEKRSTSALGNGDWWSRMRERMTMHEGPSVLDLKGENYFSCAVGRKRSSARYLLGSSTEVVSLLKELAACQL
ncbi:UNVERIFIED_CONTAM: Alpha,alpha-trehalose-phosphate synthase [UDP-forming] 1 [Sesamum radiatum]|uniref:alpha,alpha-trehalose-phosphate synthase (UDP-forming) n=1 Tax=Sesamum radiatum TaxID=300843 RepID=A0AAW2KF59_SESRA